jgi:hypothetical protein
MLQRLSTWWRFRGAVRRAARNPDREAAHTQVHDKDVVVLPCWRRPEFLWHCLDNISRADDASDLVLHIRPDTGYAPENLEVVRSFSDRIENIEIQWPTPAAFRRTKQSANVLLGYLRAAAQARRYVFLIEEDVMVGRDFFRWHRAVQAAASRTLFCSIASKNTNRRLTLAQQTEDFYLSSGDFCSIGVCFDKRVLQQRLAPHVNMSYMRSPKKYIRRHFPASQIGLGFVEQDGLIRRIQQQSGNPIAWPSVPRAFHAGFYGYNRPGEIAGALQERIATLSQTIYSSELMREASTQPQFVESSMPCELQLPPWTTLRELEVPLP